MKANWILSVTAMASLILACGGDDKSSSASTEVKPPTDLKAEPLDGAAHLTWKDNSDNEAEFMIERKTGNRDWDTVGTVPFNTTQYHDAGLQAPNTYVYRVMGMTKEGAHGAYSNEATCALPAKNVAAVGGTGGKPSTASTMNSNTGSGGNVSSSGGRGGSTAAQAQRGGSGGAAAASEGGHVAAGGTVAAGSGGSSEEAGAGGEGGAGGDAGGGGEGGASGAGGASGTAGGGTGHEGHH